MSESTYSALVVWLATLTGEQSQGNQDVSDGVKMAKALHKLDPDKVGSIVSNCEFSLRKQEKFDCSYVTVASM